MKHLFIALISFFSSLILFAQDSLHIDSIPLISEEVKEVKKTRFVFTFDSRWSRVHGQAARINGLKIGWERFEKNRYGFGIYSLRDPFVIGENRGQLYKTAATIPEDVELQSTVSAFVFFWDHLFVNSNRVEVAFSSEFGPATAELQFLDYSELDEIGNPAPVTIQEVEFAFLEFDLSGHYKILPWIGPGAGVGYRFALSQDNNVRKAFSGPIGIIKIKIFLGVIYRKIFPKKNKSKAKSD